MLGETIDFVKHGRGVTEQMAQNVAAKIREYLPDDMDNPNNYQKSTFNKLMALEEFIEENWG